MEGNTDLNQPTTEFETNFLGLLTTESIEALKTHDFLLGDCSTQKAFDIEFAFKQGRRYIEFVSFKNSSYWWVKEIEKTLIELQIYQAEIEKSVSFYLVCSWSTGGYIHRLDSDLTP
jgi:hypothetical protein